MMERFKSMTPDEQTQFIARMKDRGAGHQRVQQAAATPQRRQGDRPARRQLARRLQPKYGAAQTGETIDALFAPLPTVESQGRAWVYMDKQLKPVRLRLGITDGTNTELLSGELQPNMEVVTGVTVPAAQRAPLPAPRRGGNPLMPASAAAGGRGR